MVTHRVHLLSAVLLLSGQFTIGHAHEGPFPANSPDSPWVDNLEEAKGRLIWSHYDASGSRVPGPPQTYDGATAGATASTETYARRYIPCGPTIINPIVCNETVLSPPGVYSFHPEVTSSLVVQCVQSQSAQVLTRAYNDLNAPLVCARGLGGSTHARFFIIDRVRCPVDPLPVYSPDPYPLDIANLAPRMQTALQCLQAAIGRQTSPGGNPGTSTVDSAYRPSSYNRHLQEVWDKWVYELRRDKRPECQSLRDDVRDHFNRHDLIPNASARPHTNSAHTRGQAFDLSSNLYDGVLDALAVDCNVYRPDPLGDPPHFIHR